MRSVRFISFFVLAPLLVYADQPIFGEMPRWSGGYGVQVVQSLYERDVELAGREVDVNYHYTRIEGVYTWDKSYRLVTKLRLLNGGEGSDGEHLEAGLSDFRIAVPLKSYFNLDGRSGSYTLLPMVGVPVQTQVAGHPFVQNTQFGLGIGYDTESYFFHLGAHLNAWKVIGETQPLTTGTLGLGMNGFWFGFPGHFKLGTPVRRDPNGDFRASIKFTVYSLITDAWHWQGTWRRLVYRAPENAIIQGEQVFTLGLAYVQ